MKLLKPLIWIILIVALIAAGIFAFNKIVVKGSQKEKIAKLNEAISSLKEVTVPLRYKVISKTRDTMTVAVKFYDLDGQQIGKTQKFRLKGNTVSFDFYVAEFNNQYVAFPYKIFTDLMKPENGIIIYKYYEQNKFPMIYYSKNSSKAFGLGIEALFEKIKSGNIEDMKNIFGNMLQNSPKADSNRIDDSTYKIAVHKNGGALKIIEE